MYTPCVQDVALATGQKAPTCYAMLGRRGRGEGARRDERGRRAANLPDRAHATDRPPPRHGPLRRPAPNRGLPGVQGRVEEVK